MYEENFVYYVIFVPNNSFLISEYFSFNMYHLLKKALYRNGFGLKSLSIIF